MHGELEKRGELITCSSQLHLVTRVPEIYILSFIEKLCIEVGNGFESLCTIVVEKWHFLQ